jgi:hypothetical protein
MRQDFENRSAAQGARRERNAVAFWSVQKSQLISRWLHLIILSSVCAAKLKAFVAPRSKGFLHRHQIPSTDAERVQTQSFEDALPRYADRGFDRDASSTNNH